jgi:hypothetical protein
MDKTREAANAEALATAVKRLLRIDGIDLLLTVGG